MKLSKLALVLFGDNNAPTSKSANSMHENGYNTNHNENYNANMSGTHMSGSQGHR